MKTEVLDRINVVIGRLQEGRWSDHSSELLLSAQGTLATLQGNVSALVSDARYEKDLLNIQMKQKEAELFLKYKAEEKTTVKEADSLAYVATFEERGKVLDAEKVHQDLKGVLNAVQTMIVSIQVTLKELRNERVSANYQGNA